MLQKKLNTLSIKTKFFLLILPIATLLIIITVNTVWKEWSRYHTAHTNHSYQQVSSLLANVVYELQVERGVSSQFLGRQGRMFGDELQLQRDQTDSRVKLLQSKIKSRWNKELSGALQDDYQIILKTIAARIALRTAIDNQTLFYHETFQYYSNTHADILQFIRRLGAETHNVHLARQFEAYSSLLWLQEHSGQERAALSYVFSSGILNMGRLQLIQSYVNKQENILRNISRLLLPHQAMLLQDNLNNPVMGQVESIRSSALAKAMTIELLSQIHSQIGYGGMIHNFKNYLLRGNSYYLSKFNANVMKLQDIMDGYKNIPARHIEPAQNIANKDTHIHAIDDFIIIKDTIRKYQQMITTIDRLRAAGKSIKAIDAVVKIDDAPALRAIKHLQEDIFDVDVGDWFRYSTLRIVILNKVSQRVAGDINQHTEQIMHDARIRLSLYAALTLFAIISGLWIMTIMPGRIVRSITAVTHALLHVKETGKFDAQVDATGNDELGVMARSFNDLVTERSRIEQELQKNRELLLQAKEQADSASQAKSEFLARMNHELRTPLNAIMGFAQILEIDETLTPDQLDEINEINKAGRHLLALINDILDLAKIECGHINISLDTVDLVEVMDDCIHMILPMAEQYGRTLNYPELDNEPVLVLADVTRLKEVLLNLLSNAVKYNCEHGTVSLTIDHCSDGLLRIDITDTGPGLSVEQQKNLFKPFERLGAENSGIEGSGIGLVISKRIVEAMGGKIGISNKPGHGCTFWVELQCTGQKATRILNSSETEDKYINFTNLTDHSYNILYIEDNPSSIRLIEHIISKYPKLNLSIAMNPETGLELAAIAPPDLILMDINLPKVNGIELLKQIRRIDACKQIPILALSDNAMSEQIQDALKTGFNDCLTKPVNILNLLKSMDHFLGNEPEHDSLN